MEKINETRRNKASFRDPAATVFTGGDKVIRIINPSYFQVYNAFMERLYPELIAQDLMIPHQEVTRDEYSITIEPERVPFISYPYEWSFSMLQAAALTTLRINSIAMSQGMMLKDASAYNIQYHQGRMKLIDTTSFMPYTGKEPWPSYAQFIRHFVTPLLWRKYSDPDMRRLSEIYIDGVPIPLTNRMLPLMSKFKPGIVAHILAQSLAGVFSEPGNKDVTMRRIALTSLLDNLYKFVRNLKYRPSLKGWTNYEKDGGSYTPESLQAKKDIVTTCLAPGGTVLDLGANTGAYSCIAAGKRSQVIATDADHDCIYHLYDTPGVLPLVLDLCNPSPGIGWGNTERAAFWDRIGKADTILALALIHHLSIRNNVPLDMVADLLADHCKRLVIEWVPLEDKQAQRLLKDKQIPEYSQEVFIRAFARHFKRGFVSIPIPGSQRVIYMMESE